LPATLRFLSLSSQPPWNAAASLLTDLRKFVQALALAMAMQGFLDVPLDLVEYFKEPKKKEEQLEALRNKSPWLRELEKDVSDLRPVRKVFLEDGYTFISALEEFLDALKWREFIMAATHEYLEGSMLVNLLAYACRITADSPISAMPEALDPIIIKACGSNIEFLETISQSYAETLNSIQPTRQASNSVSERN
jgi:hypothetical protein